MFYFTKYFLTSFPNISSKLSLWLSLMVKVANISFWFTIASIHFSLLFNRFCLFFKSFSLCRKACSIICLWLEDNISSPVSYSYLPILPDENADIFAASLLMSYCSFSAKILLSIAMISFYIFCEILFLKPDARVVSLTKKEYRFAVHFL